MTDQTAASPGYDFEISIPKNLPLPGLGLTLRYRVSLRDQDAKNDADWRQRTEALDKAEAIFNGPPMFDHTVAPGTNPW
jgi:hypothetical protein